MVVNRSKEVTDIHPGQYPWRRMEWSVKSPTQQPLLLLLVVGQQTREPAVCPITLTDQIIPRDGGGVTATATNLPSKSRAFERLDWKTLKKRR